MSKAHTPQNKIAKVMALAAVLAVVFSGIASSFAQTTPPPNTTLSINKQVRNVTAGQNTFFDSAGAAPGDTVEFRIQVVNTGNNPAQNVVVSDTLPANFNLISGSTQSNLGTMAASATTTMTLTARVGDAANFPFGQSHHTNAANVTATNLATHVQPVNDTATVVVTRSADPTVTVIMEGRNLTANSSFSKFTQGKTGDKLEFRIRVSNGNGTATNVRVINNLPQGLSYVFNTLRIDGSGSTSGDLFNSHVFLGDLPAGQTRTITYEVTIAPGVQSNIVLTNSATAFMNNGPLKGDGAQVSVSQIAGNGIDLVLSQTVFNATQNRPASELTAQVNDLIVYTLTVENRGNATATNYVFEDDLTDVLKLSTLVDFSGAEFILSEHKLKWPALNILPGTKAQKAFSVRVRASTDADRTMTNFFGSTSNINVVAVAGASTGTPPATPPKFVAPRTGSGTVVSLILATLTLAGFMFARHKKLSLSQSK